jgi:hypothetical protein
MKKKIYILTAAVMIFGLAIAVYAFNSTLVRSDKAATSCCSGDSCPMKKKNADAGEKMSCCDKCDCCKDGKCKMKKEGEAKAGHADSGHKMADGESCPMMKDGDHKMMKDGMHTMNRSDHHQGHTASAEGHAGCDCGCSCCGTEKKKETGV